MKKNYVKVILITLAVLAIIGITVYFMSGEEEPNFNQVELINYGNTVINQTGIKYYDTIAFVGLQEIGITDVILVMNPLTDGAIQNSNAQGIDLQAHLKENNGDYYLYLSENSKLESIKVIAHELIHLDQYQSSDLKFQNNIVTWRGESYTPTELSYENRPWENDAFKRQGELIEKIENILLK